MELGHAFYLASDGVSCSHSGGDALCIVDYPGRAADRVYLRASYVGMRIWCRHDPWIMATIYVSGERVYITLYFILLFVTMFCIYRMADAVEEKLKQTGGKLAVTLLALICLINIGFVTLSC